MKKGKLNSITDLAGVNIRHIISEEQLSREERLNFTPSSFDCLTLFFTSRLQISFLTYSPAFNINVEPFSTSPIKIVS